jgi:hypothetical protein
MSGVVRWIPKTLLRILGPLLLLAFLPSIEGCGDSTGPETTQVKVLLTDAAAEYIESAVVTISRVYLQGCAEGDEGEECEAANLFEANPEDGKEGFQSFDLVLLQNDVTASVTPLETVPAEVYRQLRLVVEEAVVTLKSPYEFEDPLVVDPKADPPQPKHVALLKVPSGMQSGIKVNLSGPINGEAEDVTVILVDFDMEDNFVLQGPDENNMFRRILFTPTLKEKGRSHQGEVS